MAERRKDPAEEQPVGKSLSRASSMLRDLAWEAGMDQAIQLTTIRLLVPSPIFGNRTVKTPFL